MQYITSVTDKGQATIPVDIRRKLGLKKRDKVIFEVKNDQVSMKKVLDLEMLQGSLKSNIKFDDRQADQKISKMIAEDYVESN